MQLNLLYGSATLLNNQSGKIPFSPGIKVYSDDKISNNNCERNSKREQSPMKSNLVEQQFYINCIAMYSNFITLYVFVIDVYLYVNRT